MWLLLKSIFILLFLADKPSAPESLKVVKHTPTSVDLTWTPPSKDGGSKVTSYHIYKATKPGDWKEAGKVKSFENEFTVSNLKEGQDYFFAIAAENEAGIGDKCELDTSVTAEKPKRKANLFFKPFFITKDLLY